MSMKRLILAALFMFFAGCGSEYARSPSITAPANSGIYVDKAYFDTFEEEFQETVACTGIEGNFWDIAIFLMPPPRFACTGDNLKGQMCYGEFAPPNKILLADVHSWKHEVIHYLLYKNTNDLDPDHKSELFDACLSASNS